MDDLVLMTKSGETLEVHRTCVADHERLGWVVVPPESVVEPESTRQPAKRAPRRKE